MLYQVTVCKLFIPYPVAKLKHFLLQVLVTVVTWVAASLDDVLDTSMDLAHIPSPRPDPSAILEGTVWH